MQFAVNLNLWIIIMILNLFWIIEEYCFHSGTQIDWNELGLFMFYYCSLKLIYYYETIQYNPVHSLDSLHPIVTNLQNDQE